MSKQPDPLKQGENIRDLAELFIASRLGVSEAFQLAASVVLGEQEEKAQTSAIGFQMGRIEEVDECDEDDS